MRFLTLYKFFIGYWIIPGPDLYPAPFLIKSGNTELEKSKAHIIVEIIEYLTNSVVIKTIIKKTTGNISVISFDTGEGLAGRPQVGNSCLD